MVSVFSVVKILVGGRLIIKRAFFINLDRGAKAVHVVEFDTATGSTRTLFSENAEPYLRLGPADVPLFLPLQKTNELIWYSERSGYGHLYLYDLNTGLQSKVITKGEWLVRNVLYFDAEQRELLIQTAGRDENISPYYRDICKVNIDSGELTELAFRLL